MEDSTRYAVYEKGALAFAASGNDGMQRNTYPAAYNWVLAIAAVGYNGNRDHDISSTWPGNNYAYAAGTSMATPHASGIAALYWSINPAMTNAQVARALIKNADDKGTAGWDKYYGFGLVDAWPANE